MAEINISDWRRLQLTKKAKIEGMDKFLQSLKTLKLDDKEVKKVVLNAADPILNAAKRKCKSTTVRAALGYITKNDAKYPTTALFGVRSGYGTKTFTAPALAVVEEFGTVERIKKDGSSTGYIKPRPFMRPALDENRSKSAEILKAGLINLIEQKTKKI